MFAQIFGKTQVKRNLISNKKGIYGLSYELFNDLGSRAKPEKSEIFIEL